MASKTSYNVGGVQMERPFKIRRLGHVAFDVDDMAKSFDFFVRDLGLTFSDGIDLTTIPLFQEVSKTIDDPRAVFLSIASDHHSIVLLPREASLVRRDESIPKDITNGQLSLQVGSLEEVIAAKAYLESQGLTVPRIGRDLPGSNWHTYFVSPDGLTVELYYGMEQMGWARSSKPKSMYNTAVSGEVSTPIKPEYTEVFEALASGADLSAGTQGMTDYDNTHIVAGVELARPFRAVHPGPAYFFVDDTAVSADFYTRLLGLTLIETVTYKGHECLYFRAGNNHHLLGLFPKALREELGLPNTSTNYAVGLQLASYDQLRRAGAFMASQGWKITEGLPAELNPGIDRRIFVEDARGNRIMLYYYIEQIGWDGKPRPASERPEPETRPFADWPENIDALDDVYQDFPLMGPLG